MDIRHS